MSKTKNGKNNVIYISIMLCFKVYYYANVPFLPYLVNSVARISNSFIANLQARVLCSGCSHIAGAKTPFAAGHVSPRFRVQITSTCFFGKVFVAIFDLSLTRDKSVTRDQPQPEL